MAGLDHGAAHSKEVEDPLIAARNARYGMVLFTLYFAFYAAFVGLNAARPDIMDITPAWGLNLSVIYGFALIIVAMLLALIYCWLCRARKMD